MPAATLARACRKTKMCRFNLKGLCTKGEACNFAHGKEEIKPLPDFHRTRLCPTLISTGVCGNLKGCPFAHSREELRSYPRTREQESLAELVQRQGVAGAESTSTEECSNVGSDDSLPPRQSTPDSLDRASPCQISAWYREPGTWGAEERRATGPRGAGGRGGGAQGPAPRRLAVPAAAAAATGRAEEVDQEAEMEERFWAAEHSMVFGRTVTEDPERTQSFLSIKNTFIHFDADVEEERRRSSSAPCRLRASPSPERPACDPKLFSSMPVRPSAAAPAPSPPRRASPPRRLASPEASLGGGAGLPDPGRPASPIQRRAAKHLSAAPAVGGVRRLG